MVNHTAEPWTFREDGDANHYTILTGDRKRWIISFLANGEQMPEQQIANAARIVACVNACAGISTDDLLLVTKYDSPVSRLGMLSYAATTARKAIAPCIALLMLFSLAALNGCVAVSEGFIILSDIIDRSDAAQKEPTP